jgi:NRPS condensation-like uncharacterized protein
MKTAKRKYNDPKRPHIVCIRITDDEMENIQQMIGVTNKNASDVMRDAFALFSTNWKQEKPASKFVPAHGESLDEVA